jgi:hypothetical protein
MKLNPLTEAPTPEYPTHRRRFAVVVRWLRRGAVTAIVTGALSAAGCYGLAPYDRDESDDTDESDIELNITQNLPPIPEEPEISPGGERAPGFQCEAPPDWYVMSTPAYLDGSLCGEETAFAQFDIWERARYEVSFQTGADVAFVALLGPAGEDLGEIGPGSTSLSIELDPGRYLLAANPVDPVSHPNDWFSVLVQLDAP